MHPFRNLKITHQFLILFVLLVGGFIAIGLTYVRVLDVEEASASHIRSVNELGAVVNRIVSDISALDAEQKDFLFTKDLQHAEQFETLIGQAYKEIDNLEQIVLEQRTLGLTTQLREELTAYDDSFDALLNGEVLLGLDENRGLQGEMHAAAHVVEESLQGLDQPALGASLLRKRRHEKNFILRNAPRYVEQLHEEQATFAALLDKASIPAHLKEAIRDEMAIYDKGFDAFVMATEQRNARIDDVQTALFAMQRLLDALQQQKTAMIETDIAQATSERTQTTVFFSGVMIAVGSVVAVVLLLLALRMRRSLGRIQETVQRVAEGDFSARSQLTSGDELGTLGNAFDNLLNDRVVTLSAMEHENETLNESIIALMGAVAQMSQRDLTVKAVVAEDVTGAVSDAVNLMASETATVLSHIRAVSQEVEQAAKTVRVQADKVNEVAARERRLVQETAADLQQAGQAMSQLAQGAQGANDQADVAMAHTRQALTAVSTTIGGIEQIRDIIRETEKRIKRLGECSQEITGAVNLINTIAERTHILALNASMHAASAGEAGRGFAVVADEVQRLAESSRKATSDIASMVNAIRIDTADTVDTMNRLIAQVAEGTRLAQESGQRMQETETTTAELLAAVRQMAERAEQQARDAQTLMERAQGIVSSTEQTSEELQEQSSHTVKLVDYSNALREAVDVFQLPAAAA